MLEFREKFDTLKLNKDTIILDIETTGVSRVNSNVIIVGILDSNNILSQFAIDNIKNEKQLLIKIKPFLENKTIITYNGENFDIPFLKDRYDFYNIESFKENSQFDLYRYFLKNRLINDIYNFSLQDIEKYLNIERYENFEFNEDFILYKDLNNIDLSKILLHNKYDVMNTKKVYDAIYFLEKRKIFFVNNTKFHIKDIYIEKNFLKIKIDTVFPKIEHYYQNSNYLFDWNKNHLKINLKIIQGYLSENLLGYVYKLHSKKIANKINNKNYNVPNNFSVIFDDRFFLENIIEILKSIIEKYFQE